MDITCVLSIGCFCDKYNIDTMQRHTFEESEESVSGVIQSPKAPYAPIQYLCYPDIHDTPETPLVLIFPTTSEFISNCIQMGRKVLVHCVYGQSRSAAVVVAYMLSIGYELSHALATLKSLHPDICINPGFLAQLYLEASVDKASAEYRLLTHSMGPSSLLSSGVFARNGNSRTSSNDALSTLKPRYFLNGCETVLSMKEDKDKAAVVGRKRKQSSQETDYISGDAHRSIFCKSCKTALVPERDVVSRDLSAAAAAFTEEHLDEFWRGYISPSSYKSKDKKKKQQQQQQQQKQRSPQGRVKGKQKNFYQPEASGRAAEKDHQSLGSTIDETIFVRYDANNASDEDDIDGIDATADESTSTSFAFARPSISNFNSAVSSSRRSSLDSLEANRSDLRSFLSGTSSEIESIKSVCFSDDMGQVGVQSSPLSPLTKDGGLVRSLVAGYILVVPQDWMLKQMRHLAGEEGQGQGSLSCPGCSSVCGYWKENALNMIGEYNLSDVFALQESCVRMKRRIRNKKQ